MKFLILSISFFSTVLFSSFHANATEQKAYCKLRIKINESVQTKDVSFTCDSGGLEQTLISEDGNLKVSVFSDESCLPILWAHNVEKKISLVSYFSNQREHSGFEVFKDRVVASSLILNAAEDDVFGSDNDLATAVCSSKKELLEEVFED